MNTTKVLTAIALMAVASACAGPTGPEAVDDLREVLDRGTLVVFGSPDQHSRYFRFMVEEYGKEGLEIIGGDDVDYLRGFAESLGVSLETRTLSRDELPSYSKLFDEFLATPDVDLLAGAITVTETRRGKGIVFSEHYMQYTEVLMAARGSMVVNELADLAGKTAVVMKESAHHERMMDSGVPISFHIAAFYSEFPELLQENEGFFAPVSGERARQFMEEFPDTFEIVYTFPEPMEVAFGLKRDGTLRQALDRYILETREP